MLYKNKLYKKTILPGFNPDPSICKVDEDYYIATSSFEFYPGFRFITAEILLIGN